MIRVFDNFLENVDEIRNYALQLDYFSPNISENWLGFRTKPLNYSDNFSKQVKENVLKSFTEIFSIQKNNISFTSAFHFSPLLSQQILGDLFEISKFHVDYSANYAGVLYLSPNPPKNTGTSFKKGKTVKDVENQYNRLLLYDAKIPHAPTNFFGEDVNDSRLTYVFFIEKKNILEIFSSPTANIFTIK